MTGISERRQVMVLLTEAISAGARQDRACAVLGLSARTVQRWQPNETVRGDKRPERLHAPASKLSELERIRLLAVVNSAEFGHLPPSQIVPRLADRGEYLASESTFYRVLRAENQLTHRRAERPAQKRAKPRALCARAPNHFTLGISPTCRRRSGECISISTCSWTYLVARWWAGRSTRKKAVSWAAR